jgi:hypothetical protein
MSSLGKVVPFHKTSDKDVDAHDIDKGPMREVELRGGFLTVSFPHPQHLEEEDKFISIAKNQSFLHIH